MPNQSHSAVVGVPWHRCDICGCDQRVTDLQRQNGLLKCRVYDCINDRLVERRPRMIAEKLFQTEEMQPADILRYQYVDDVIETL